MATTTKRITLDEFLAMPETEPPSELIDGEVVQKPMPSVLHGLIATLLSIFFGTYLQETKEGIAVAEPRHAQRDESRAYLPDISIIRRGTLTRHEFERGPVERVPDIAIEILSPDDRASRVAEKVAFYLRAGTPLVWVIDPLDRTLDVHRPGHPSTHHAPPDVVDALPVLKAFALDLAELFARVDESGAPGK